MYFMRNTESVMKNNKLTQKSLNLSVSREPAGWKVEQLGPKLVSMWEWFPLQAEDQLNFATCPKYGGLFGLVIKILIQMLVRVPGFSPQPAL